MVLRESDGGMTHRIDGVLECWFGLLGSGRGRAEYSVHGDRELRWLW
jgi:hypothetical protein